jgi:hypothetical protein
LGKYAFSIFLRISNKVDLPHAKSLKRSEIIQRAAERNIPFLDVSIYYNINVDKILEFITLKMVYCNYREPLPEDKKKCILM